MSANELEKSTERLADLALATGPLSMAGDHDPMALAAAAANYRMLRDGWCQCQMEAEAVYFRNPATGTHGWMCSVCRSITQIG